MNNMLTIHRRAFTLIEMLVVTGLIGLLVALLVPTLMRAKLLTKQAMCMASLSVLGKASAVYQSTWNGYVPICWGNIATSQAYPWPSWRVALLPYTPGVAAFNCLAAEDTPEPGEVFHTIAELTVRDPMAVSTVNEGSYGVMVQDSLPSYQTLNCAGQMKIGNPILSCAYSTAAGEAWKEPAESVYIADGCLANGPMVYPSVRYKDHGTSCIFPPSTHGYSDGSLTRRFADRHLGTNCLFIGGNVRQYVTKNLDSMVAGRPDCVWDVR